MSRGEICPNRQRRGGARSLQSPAFMRDHDRSLGEAAPPDDGHRGSFTLPDEVLQTDAPAEPSPPLHSDVARREPLRSRPWDQNPEAEPARASGLMLLFVMLLSAVAVVGALYLLW